MHVSPWWSKTWYVLDLAQISWAYLEILAAPPWFFFQSLESLKPPENLLVSPEYLPLGTSPCDDKLITVYSFIVIANQHFCKMMGFM